MNNDKKESNENLNHLITIPSFPQPPDAMEIVLLAGATTSLANMPVSSMELTRAAGMSHQDTRMRFLTGRRMVRGMLSRWLSLPPADLPIAIDSDGKPYLENDRTLHFNIAHSGELVLVAFARFPVGADVEEEREIDAAGLAGRFFTPVESRAVQADAGLFFPLWTRREAAVKADGRGLARMLSTTVPMDLGSNGWRAVSLGDSLWQTYAWRDGRHHLALAAPTIPRSILWHDLRKVVL